MPFDFWSWEEPEEQRKRHAADFATEAAKITENVQRSQVQEYIGGLLEGARNAASQAWQAMPSPDDARSVARSATSWMDPVMDPLMEVTGVAERDRRLGKMQGILDQQSSASPTQPSSARDMLTRAGGSTIGGTLTAPRELDPAFAEQNPDAAHQYRDLYDEEQLNAFSGIGGGVKIAGAVFGNAAAGVVRGAAAQKVAQSYGVAHATPKVDLGLKRLIYNVFDDLAPVRDVMDGLANRLGRALTDNENAYEILRLGRASNEIGDAWFKQHVGPALDDLQNISGSVAQGRADLSDYLRAADAIDKDKVIPGRNYGGFTAADGQQALQEIQARLGPQAYKRLESAAGRFYRLGNFLLQKKVDAGLVSPQLAADLMQKYPRYMPIQVIDWLDDNLARTSAQVGKVGGAANDIKKLTEFGTDRAAEDPLQAFYRLSQRTAMQAAKNRAGTAIVEAAQTDPILSGLVRAVGKGVQRKPGEELLQIRRNGDIEQYFVDRALKPLVDYGTTVGDNVWNSLLSPLANVTRKAAIAYNPTWGMGQFVMDSLSFIIKEGGIAGNPIKNLGYLGEGLKEAVTKGAVYRDAARSGALPGSVDYVSGKAGSYEGVIREMTGRDVTSAKDLFLWLRDGLGKNLKNFNETLDAAPRLAEYARVRDAGGTAQKAALAARDVTIDPSRGGHVVRQINAVVPFFNVAFQGAAYLPRMLKNPDPEVRRKALLGITTSVMMPAMALEYLNEQDPRYANVPDFDKDRGFIIMAPWGKDKIDPVTGKEKVDPVTGEAKPNYFLVRTGPFTPFVLLARAMAREAMVAGGVTDRGMDTKKTLIGLSKSTSPVDVSSPIEAALSGQDVGESATRTAASLLPAGIKQVAEVMANYDTFRDRNIVPKGLENQPAERQFTENTSQTAKLIGSAFGAVGLNVAPAVIDHLMRSWGGAADYAVQLTDSALDVTGISEKGDSQRTARIKRELARSGLDPEKKAELEGELAREMLIKADREGALKNTPVVGGLLSRYYREQGGQTIEDRTKALDKRILDKKSDTGIVGKELSRLDVGFSDVKDEISGVKLTRTQGAAYREKALDYRERLLNSLIEQDYYQKANDVERKRMLRDAMQRAAGWASQEILPGKSDVGVEFQSVGGIEQAVPGYLKALKAKQEYDELSKTERFRNIDPEDYEQTVKDISELQSLKMVLGEDEAEMIFIEKYGDLRFARASTAKESKRWRDLVSDFKEGNPDYVRYLDTNPRIMTRRGLSADEVARMAGL